MTNIHKILRKEFNSFFASPAAWLFLGSFLLVTLFVFFWAEAFFARNIADLKPLFESMPVLLVFLVGALTMRSWSEERRSGTLESLLTSPVTPLQLVAGKFAASLALVAVALLLTLPLPVTVSLLGPLDWGPVIGGYLASLFLAAAYVAIGLYMSARTDNPIVALILTVAFAGFFYLIGSPVISTLFGHKIGGILELLGSGSRFDSITRGVLDIRDMYYYLSIVGIFLSLNLLALEKIRWAGNPSQAKHKQWHALTGLIVINLILANIWLHSVGSVRVDLTQGKIYSLSDSTGQYIKQAQEPLLIRGYFSAKSHPLLEPLVPQIKNLLKEYQVIGGNYLRVEFVDPHKDQAIAEEAAEKYSIKPLPFHMASRYQSGVVNSYFDLVIAYGDQFETLSFNDLIDIKGGQNGQPEVLLKNPEYAITRTIRKVINSYQAGGNAFSELNKPITFHGYISPDKKLPKELVKLRKNLVAVLEEFKNDSNGKLQIEFTDPDANGGQIGRQLHKDYGFSPQIADFFDPKPFWFYMILKSQGEMIQIPIPAELNKAEIKNSIQAAVKRSAPGYLKTVTMVAPSAPAAMNPYMPQPRGKSYEQLKSFLEENVRVISNDLLEGHVPTDTDLLLLMSPEGFDEKQLFAVDQFLMQGGSVIVATSPFDVSINNTLTAEKHNSGLTEWLKHHGITIEDSMVLDPQNASLPIPVKRQVGSVSVDEIRMMPYPHFPDIRKEGLNKNNPVTSALRQMTLNWASPINIDKEKNAERKVSELLYSSEESWISDSLNIMPDYRQFPKTGFSPEKERAAELLAVAISGSFTSFFTGKDSPLIKKDKSEEELAEWDKSDPAHKEDTSFGSVIQNSSDSARLFLISSNTFSIDSVIGIASQSQNSSYTAPLEFLQNAIEWALNDQGLLSIRSRSQFARTLQPMKLNQQLFWEYMNYGLAIVGLIVVGFLRMRIDKKKRAEYNKLLAEV